MKNDSPRPAAEDPPADRRHAQAPRAQPRREAAGQRSAAQDFIETAASAYFNGCRRVARAISHIKRRRKKR